MANEQKLTKGQAEFLAAVRSRQSKSFHIRVIEPVERLGLVQFCGGTFRLVGRNAYPAHCFVPTEAA